MPKRKQDFNTIYISERLQEALRPISRCALTAVVAPMGYGKTTAVNWYLAERGKEENARIIRESLRAAGYTVYGGVNAPYIWLKVPHGDSWRFFDELLERHHIVATPGAGFGRAGEGYLRMTAFATRENTLRAMERIRKG